ncbi:hypothetical protein E4U61_004346 [Claviceps capensis]|nr:hypothetical protein E4U61_004346 [Claviceps capensis]
MTFSSDNQCNLSDPHHEASLGVSQPTFFINHFTTNFIILSDTISHGVPRHPHSATHPLRVQAARLQRWLIVSSINLEEESCRNLYPVHDGAQ